MTHFICRLNAPRPSFAQDMSDDERSLMGRHVAYWTDLLGKGRAVIFGPVADPKGFWGLVIVAVENPEDVKQHTSMDPVILADCGFSYDIWPMVRAVTRP